MRYSSLWNLHSMHNFIVFSAEECVWTCCTWIWCWMIGKNYIRFFLYILWAIPNLTVTREPSKLEVQQIIPFLSELFLIYHSQSFFFFWGTKPGTYYWWKPAWTLKNKGLVCGSFAGTWNDREPSKLKWVL